MIVNMIDRLPWEAVSVPARKALMLMSVVACIGIGAKAHAAPVYYGDFIGQNVSFLDVHEDSATDPPPLYQVAGSQPILETQAIGGVQYDRLIFSPGAAFRASAHSGAYDETDGLLRFTLALNPNAVLLDMNLTEGGDWVTCGGATFVGASGAMIATQGSNIRGTTIDSLFYDGIWTGHATLDLSTFTDNGTILIAIDNILEAFADEADGDVDQIFPRARIAKKAFVIEIATVPEPGTLMLLAGGTLFVFRRNRRSSPART